MICKNITKIIPLKKKKKKKSAQQQITKKLKKVKLGRLEGRSPELTSPPSVPHATAVQTEETERKINK